MTETKNPSEKTLSVTPTKTIVLKRGVEHGVVRQSFSHGRTKPVVVEKVKRRAVGGDTKAEAAPAKTSTAKAAAAAPAVPTAPAPVAQPAGGTSPKLSGVVLRTLTEEE